MSYGTTQQETDKVRINRIIKIPRYFQIVLGKLPILETPL